MRRSALNLCALLTLPAYELCFYLVSDRHYGPRIRSLLKQHHLTPRTARPIARDAKEEMHRLLSSRKSAA